ncbi:MAG: energy transducer TonB [Candidatus Aminicenantes bacterium]|nr:energy transducer TonB [Candidatus Aminicenantes bacterium]
MNRKVISLFSLLVIISFSLSCYTTKPTENVLPLVRTEGVLRRPKLIKEVKPIYPRSAREEGVEGTVILQVGTDIHGRVQYLRILQSIPPLDQAAIDAARQWRYEPILIDGKPREGLFVVTMKFKLKIKNQID